MKMTKKIFGIILILTGLYLYISEVLIERKNITLENNKIEYTLAKEISYKYENRNDLYDAILSIPQINLMRGIYTKEDKKNNIEENIMIHKDSIYPNIDNSNVILIAHSGNSSISFFKNLSKLNEDSLIEFYYKHVKYVYKINNWYDVDKNGEVEIKKETNKKTITLITCSQIDKYKQTIYIGYLIDEINY